MGYPFTQGDVVLREGPGVSCSAMLVICMANQLLATVHSNIQHVTFTLSDEYGRDVPAPALLVLADRSNVQRVSAVHPELHHEQIPEVRIVTDQHQERF